MKNISGKVLKFGYLPVMLWALGNAIYTNFGDWHNPWWWAFDKINDRACMLMLVAYAFLISYDFRQKIFYLIGGGYIITVLSFELTYIFTQKNDFDQYSSILLLLLSVVCVTSIIVNHVRSN